MGESDDDIVALHDGVAPRSDGVYLGQFPASFEIETQHDAPKGEGPPLALPPLPGQAAAAPPAPPRSGHPRSGRAPVPVSAPAAGKASQPASRPDPPLARPALPPAADWYHAAFHSVCAVVGAGVLGLPHAFSFLGWAGGLAMLTLFCTASIYTSYLLSALHERPGSGVRLNTYRQMGEAILGVRLGKYLIQPVQFTLCVGLCITYSVTAGQSLKVRGAGGRRGVSVRWGASVLAQGALEYLLCILPPHALDCAPKRVWGFS